MVTLWQIIPIFAWLCWLFGCCLTLNLFLYNQRYENAFDLQQITVPTLTDPTIIHSPTFWGFPIVIIFIVEVDFVTCRQIPVSTDWFVYSYSFASLQRYTVDKKK
mgnify:CR=1 FL=1